MRNYEIIYVLKPQLEEEAQEAILNKMKGIIEDGKGEVVKVDIWGKRRLAYPIEKITEGYYVLMNFKSDAAVPKEMDRNLKISDNVMRHIIVNLDEK